MVVGGKLYWYCQYGGDVDIECLVIEVFGDLVCLWGMCMVDQLWWYYWFDMGLFEQVVDVDFEQMGVVVQLVMDEYWCVQVLLLFFFE